jgi:PST family polysaccharide transporter
MTISSNSPLRDPLVTRPDLNSLAKQTVLGSLTAFLSQIAKMSIQICGQIILARMLFPSDFGLVAMVYPLTSLAQVFNDIGLGHAIVQRQRLEQDRISTLFWVNMALSCMLACSVAAMAPAAAWMYGEPRIAELTLVLCVLLPVSALGIHPTALLSRQMRFGLLALSDVTAALFGMTVAVFCASKDWSYWSLVFGQFVNIITGNTLAWILCRWRPSRPKFIHSVWTDLKFGGNLTGANLATFVTTSADNVIIGLTAGPASLGLFDRSYRLVVQPLGQLLLPISRVAIPLLSRLADRPDLYRSAYLQMFRVILLLTVPGMLICITGGSTIIDVFLGTDWSEAAPIFSWICVGGLTAGVYSSSYWLFISQDRTREMRRFMTIASIINVISFVVGAIWGVIGVAAAGALVFVFGTTPLVLYGATRRGPVRFEDLVRCGIPFAMRATAVYTLLLAAQHYLTMKGFERIALTTLLSYGGVFTLSLLSSQERRSLYNATRTLAALCRR